jgi:hypothetical protein
MRRFVTLAAVAAGLLLYGDAIMSQEVGAAGPTADAQDRFAVFEFFTREE